MKDERNHIDHLFRAALDNHTEAPPPDVWAALEQRLPEKKSRRRFGWLWAGLILLALLGGTAAVYSILGKDRNNPASVGRTLADGDNRSGDNTAGSNSDINLNPGASGDPAGANTGSNTGSNPTNSSSSSSSAGPATPGSSPVARPSAGRQSVAGNPSRNGRAARQRTPRANNATANDRGSNAPNAASGNNAGNPVVDPDNTPAGNRTPGRGRRTRGNNAAQQNGVVTSSSNLGSTANNQPTASTGSAQPATPQPKARRTRATGTALPAPANVAANSGATLTRPRQRNRANNAAGNTSQQPVAGANSNATVSGSRNRQPGTRQRNPGTVVPDRGANAPSGNMASGNTRRPAANTATAGNNRQPNTRPGNNRRGKDEDGIVVPPSTADRNPATTQPAVNPPVQPTVAQRNDPTANPATQQATPKPAARFTDDDPRGSKGLLVSDYINPKAAPAASTVAATTDADGADETQPKTTNAAGGGGGGGGGVSNPKAKPAPRGRWEGGVKLGYEVGAGGDHINKAVMGPYVQYNFSDRVALVFQPAYKSGQFKSSDKSMSEIFINPTAPLSVTTTSFLVDSVGGGGLDTFYTQVVSQGYDSTIVSSRINGQSFWEVELPLLFSYQLNRMFSFFAGPVFSFNRQFTQSGRRETYSINQSQVFDSLDAPAPIAAYNGILSGGQTSLANAQTTSTSEVRTGLGIGYMAGLQARFGMVSADLTVQQRIGGMPEKAKAPAVHSALSMPYIRLSIGVRLFGNGKKQPTDRDMVNEQPYQRSEE